MNHEEEQAMELEALQSIFVHEGELEVISDKHFILRLLPHPEEDEENENHVECKLEIRYPPTYPEVPADVVLVEAVAAATGPGAEAASSSGRQLPEKKIPEVKAVIATSMEENAGMAMIYPLAEAVQEYLRENNVRELTMHEEMMLREKAKGGGEEDEDDEDDEFDGEPENGQEEEWRGLMLKELCAESERLTAQLFLDWRTKYESETVKKTVSKISTVSGKAFFQKQQQENGGLEVLNEADEEKAADAFEIEDDGEGEGDEEDDGEFTPPPRSPAREGQDGGGEQRWIVTKKAPAK